MKKRKSVAFEKMISVDL